MVFNEHVIYKDKLEASSSDNSESSMIELDISNSSGSKEIQNEEEVLEEEPRTPPPINLLSIPARERRPPDRYSPSNYYLLLTDGGEPECYAKAVHNGEKRRWRVSMNDEFTSLLLNSTWELVELPRDKKVLHCKWVY